MFDYADFNKMFFVEMVYSLYHRAAISTRHQQTDRLVLIQPLH